jgi:hypothetical protein
VIERSEIKKWFFTKKGHLSTEVGWLGDAPGMHRSISANNPVLKSRRKRVKSPQELS